MAHTFYEVISQNVNDLLRSYTFLETHSYAYLGIKKTDAPVHVNLGTKK